MKSIEKEPKVLETEPHDIAAIPAASLWELCRRFDAETGKSLKGVYSGLCVYEYFKRQTETKRVSHDIGHLTRCPTPGEGFVFTPEIEGEMEVTLEAFGEVVRRALKEEAFCNFKECWV